MPVTRMVLAVWVSFLMIAVSPQEARGAPRVTALEVVTQEAATGDGGNAWGGHQCRIVRTNDGVFTAFTVAGRGAMHREWRLAHRRQGEWRTVAQGASGREPVSLLAAPDGTLHVVAWPDGRPQLWSGRPGQGTLTLRREPVPGLPHGNWPYGSAGVDDRGRLFVLASEGSSPGAFLWAVRSASSGEWALHRTDLDYRHCYTYVMPDRTGGLSLVSTRDVTWETLGCTRPDGAFAYAFNAFGFWHTPAVSTTPLKRVAYVLEEPTKQYPVPVCNAQIDAHMDTNGRMRILYRRCGQSTGGRDQYRCALLSSEGDPITDTAIPAEAGSYCRIVEDDRGQVYLLGSSGVLYPVAADGLAFGRPWRLDLQGHAVEYSGFGVAVARTGTRPGRSVDAVFPSDQGRKWVYCRIALRDGQQETTEPSSADGALDSPPSTSGRPRE